MGTNMATVTKTIATCGDNVEFQYDYDNVTFFMTAFRCINNSGGDVFGQVTKLSNGRTRGTTFPTGTTNITIGTSAAQRLALITRPDGRLDGMEFQVRCPAVI